MDPAHGARSNLATSIGKLARPWGMATVFVVLITGFLLSWHSLTDIDIWFHLRAGRDLLAGGGIPHANTYSFTEPDHEWVNHEWLFQVLAAAVGPSTDRAVPDPDVTGWHVLRLILGLVVTGLMAWSAGLFRRLRDPSTTAAVWTGVALMLSFLLLWPRLTLRPELVSYALFILTVAGSDLMMSRGLSKTESAGPGSYRRVALATLGTVVWVQFHGFAALAPAVLAMAALLTPWDHRWRRITASVVPGRARELWLAAGGATVALCLGPGGWRGLVYPVKALSQFRGSQVDLRGTISELVPLLDSPNSLAWTITAFKVSVAVGIVWILVRGRRLSLLRIAIFAAGVLAAASSQRSIGMYALTFCLLFAPAKNTWKDPHWLRRTWPSRANRWLSAVGLALLLTGSALWWPAIADNTFYLHEGVGRRFGAGVNPARYPASAVAELARKGDLRYFANLDGAAFALAYAPGRIFIDGRTEAYSSGLWAEYLTIKSGGEPALKVLDRHRVQSVCVTAGSRSFEKLGFDLLAANDWWLVAADGAGLLFDRVARLAEPGDQKKILRAGAESVADLARRYDGARAGDYFLAAARLAAWSEDEALETDYLRQGYAASPNHPVVLHNLGHRFMVEGRFAEALEMFVGALSLNPRLAGSALNAGFCQARLDDREAARVFFRRAARISPGFLEAWLNLAATELALGHRADARAAAEEAARIQPGHPGVRAIFRRIGNEH